MRFPRVALIVGIVVIVVGAAIGVPLFDLRWLNWVGLMTYRPATEDYVPLLPWFGVVLVGISIGWWLLERRRHAPAADLTRLTWLADLARTAQPARVHGSPADHGRAAATSVEHTTGRVSLSRLILVSLAGAVAQRGRRSPRRHETSRNEAQLPPEISC